MNMNKLFEHIHLFLRTFLEESKKKFPLLLMRKYLLAVSDHFRLNTVHVCCLDLLSVLINSVFINSAYLK